MAIPYNCIGIAIADEVNRDKYTYVTMAAFSSSLKSTGRVNCHFQSKKLN